MQGREWKDNSKGMDSEGSKLDRGEFAEESQRYLRGYQPIVLENTEWVC